MIARGWQQLLHKLAPTFKSIERLRERSKMKPTINLFLKITLICRTVIENFVCVPFVKEGEDFMPIKDRK